MVNWLGKNGEPLFAYEGGLNIILFVVLLALSQKKRKTGFISGIYFVGYGMIRVALEKFTPNREYLENIEHSRGNNNRSDRYILGKLSYFPEKTILTTSSILFTRSNLTSLRTFFWKICNVFFVVFGKDDMLDPCTMSGDDLFSDSTNF